MTNETGSGVRSGGSSLRVGKFLEFVDLTYQRYRRQGEPAHRSRATVALTLAAQRDRVQIGSGDAQEGTITAIELALRDSIGKTTGIEIPTTELLSFEIRVATGRTSPRAPVTAKAKLRLNGRSRHVRVDHPDGATAGAFLLFDAYDELLFERWHALLKPAQINPEDVLARVRKQQSRIGGAVPQIEA